mmetsp:Transcript_11401/g.22608  ORF Transcript_11401/g.22608 Transcript_11401/m.22608 type:complete len:253 (+) Transcript_11401:208-966(+)
MGGASNRDQRFGGLALGSHTGTHSEPVGRRPLSRHRLLRHGNRHGQDHLRHPRPRRGAGGHEIRPLQTLRPPRPPHNGCHRGPHRRLLFPPASRLRHPPPGLRAGGPPWQGGIRVRMAGETAWRAPPLPAVRHEGRAQAPLRRTTGKGPAAEREAAGRTARASGVPGTSVRCRATQGLPDAGGGFFSHGILCRRGFLRAPEEKRAVHGTGGGVLRRGDLAGSAASALCSTVYLQRSQAGKHTYRRAGSRPAH